MTIANATGDVTPTPTPEPTPTPQPTPEPAPQEPSANYNKILTEKKNYQSANYQLKEEVAVLREQIKQKEQAELEAQQKYQELAEFHKTEAITWKEKYQAKEQESINLTKKSAVRKAFKDNGFSDAQVNIFLENDVVKLDNVKYDTETGVVYGMDEMVGRFKDAFRSDQSVNPPTVNASTPNSTPQDIDLETFKKMPLDQQRQHQEALYAKLGIKRRV
jgi:cell division septum initiation protein DivIVA